MGFPVQTVTRMGTDIPVGEDLVVPAHDECAVIRPGSLQGESAGVHWIQLVQPTDDQPSSPHRTGCAIQTAWQDEP